MTSSKVTLALKDQVNRYDYKHLECTKKFLNWKPMINFKNGIEELLKNIHFWKAAPLWDKTKN